MPKIKTQDKAPDKASPPAPDLQKQPKTPEKQSGPSPSAQTLTEALPPSSSKPPAARAADLMTASEGGSDTASRARMMRAMQGTVGNARISCMMGTQMQAKLTVGAPDDIYEQEADRMADTVIRKPEPPTAPASQIAAGQPVSRISRLPSGSLSQNVSQQPAEEETIQRQLEEEGHLGSLERQPADDEEVEDTGQAQASLTAVQAKRRECEKDQKSQQRKGPEASPANKTDTTSAEWAVARSSVGTPLSATLQARMEQGFGADLSGVRVHTDTAANKAAQSLNARAFTRGSDIYLARGESPTDRGLLGHELAHVIQQRVTGSKNQSPNLDVQRKIMIAGRRLWYTLWLAREWNEMTARQRQLFLRRHFRGTRDFALARRIVEDMAAASDELEFDDESELLREVRKRIGTSRLMRESQRERRVRGRLSEAFGYPNRPPAAGCGPRVNEAAKRYWGPKEGNYHFNLSPLGRRNAYEALTTLFTPQTDSCKRTLIHCDYLISVVHFRAFAESIGRSEFNKRVRDGDIPMVLKWNGFADLEQSFWRSSRRESLQVVRVSRREDLIIGDHVLLFNHASYDALIQGVGGVWRLENAILVDRSGGQDLFQGHGYSRPVTELQMKRGMRRQYAKHVEKVRRAIKGLRSRSARKRQKSRQTLSRYTGIKRRGGEYRIIGRGFCGTMVNRPVRTPSLAELPGLNDPCNPGKLWPVRRPVESD